MDTTKLSTSNSGEPPPASLTAKEPSGAAIFFRTLMLGPAAWKRWWLGLVRQIDHAAILHQVDEDASFSFNFVFMTVISGGIATIGLLLNSPAVIIGAMLISPLMGPIVSGGIALVTLDVNLARKSLRTLALGIFAAIAFTALIVLISPVKELTSELLARARPNLFDLLVAILSGAAGGYAMIRGRGGAIVGVAIATALMPPLATVGYAIVTQRWPVARGALLLFVTNMAAISLAVAAVAEWYGFGRGGLRKRFARQAVISLLVLAPLAIPLFYSLKAIAFESLAQTSIRRVLADGAATLPDGQLGEVTVQFRNNLPPLVRAVIFSTKPTNNLSQIMDSAIEHELDSVVDLHLIQILATGDVSSQFLAQDRIEQQRKDIAKTLRAGFPLPLAAFDVDLALQRATLVPEAKPEIGLAAWQRMEADLAARYPDWTVRLLPPPQPLPMVRFSYGSASVDPVAQECIETIAWSMKRWKVGRAQVTGHASFEGKGSLRLARFRSDHVAELLRAQGVEVEVEARYPDLQQHAIEKEWGHADFRSVSVSLPAGARNLTSSNH